MGGQGSGRPGWRPKRERRRSLDVNRLSKAGCLEPGYWGAWSWLLDGVETASIGLRAEEGVLELDYRSRSGEEGGWEPIRYGVPHRARAGAPWWSTALLPVPPA